MNKVSFNITQSEEEGTQVLVYIDGKPYTAGESHPSFERILKACLAKDYEALPSLFNVGESIQRKLSRVSERISIGADRLYFDAEPLFGRLTDVILETWRAGRDFTPLVNFLENLMQNPSAHSRQQLYEFLERHDFAITSDGHFLAYKGVLDGRLSVHAGFGVVNGEVFEFDRLPNPDGAIVEMGRDKVVEDPDSACAVGLHVGTYSYASSFAPVVLLIKVNPRDAVSVPHDASYQKIRVTRYQVLREVENTLNDLYYNENGEEESEDFWLDDEWSESYDPDLDAFNDPDDEVFEEELEDAVTALEEEAANYTFKGRMANSYSVLGERLGFSQEVADYLDGLHSANAVYRYHVDRLRNSVL